MKILLSLMLCMGLCACATNPPNPATVQVLEQAGVLVAVTTAEQKGVTAAEINHVCKVALQADSGTSATLAAVTQLLDQQFAKLNLPSGDVAAVNILMVALSAALATQLQSNPSVATAQANIATVLNYAIADTGG